MSSATSATTVPSLPRSADSTAFAVHCLASSILSCAFPVPASSGPLHAPVSGFRDTHFLSWHQSRKIRVSARMFRCVSTDSGFPFFFGRVLRSA